jgi:isopenicillin N synthase-like dioxygenase
MRDLPVVDISSFTHGTLRDKLALARKVDEVCRDTGFLAVVGHDIPSEIIAAAWNTAKGFFDLPLDQKLEVEMPYANYPYGYAPLQSEILARSLGNETPPDLKESFSIGPLDRPSDLAADPWDDSEAAFRFAPNLWPKQPLQLKSAWSAYYRAMSTLAADIMRVFALALALPEGYFDKQIDQHTSAMRALNYPEISRPPSPGQLRAGAHSDYGSLTILLTEQAPGGLEIYTRDGEWQEVPVSDNTFIVNIGDLMARWTNDRWVSTLHRVVFPPLNTSRSVRRQSIAFFHQPNWDAEISCLPTCVVGEKPKYAPVRSGTYLMEKFRRTVKGQLQNRQ